ncbi:transformer-2 protein homolog alpha [Eupeodes corollae]|uniref:transformer-2 protein homolog alpha n=1 Tax=Eupeodes corollae TaxID=290404 RepID=UPI00248FB46A|nr:transformer-2 protein homolog alpha [Eupeodes corollae]
MPEKMNRRMTPRSASRSISRSPVRRNGRRKTPSYSRSRSNSRSPPPPRKNGGRRRTNSRSRSRSFSPRYRRRSRSRSPYGSKQQRRTGTRDKPLQSRCLGIFGLSIHTDEHKIRDLFSKYGRIERIQVVLDAKTGRSRGFCFVYFDDLKDAKVAKDGTNGLEIDGRRIRVDYSITQRPHTPTPGVYMGQPTRAYKEREYHDRYREDYRSNKRQSGSPYRDRRRQYERSRSRSYSARRSRY